LYSQNSATDDDKSLTVSDFEGGNNDLADRKIEHKQEREEGGNNDLADRKIERKRKREESSASNTCKKSKVS
jgi:hypothetical protein